MHWISFVLDLAGCLNAASHHGVLVQLSKVWCLQADAGTLCLRSIKLLLPLRRECELRVSLIIHWNDRAVSALMYAWMHVGAMAPCCAWP